MFVIVTRDLRCLEGKYILRAVASVQFEMDPIGQEDGGVSEDHRRETHALGWTRRKAAEPQQGDGR